MKRKYPLLVRKKSKCLYAEKKKVSEKSVPDTPPPQLQQLND